MANGRTLKDFFPREVSSLLPIPENLMTGEVKDILQKKIRETGGAKWSKHTRKLPPLEIGSWVQLQNLRGRYPLKSDTSGIVIGKHNENSYAVKVNGSENVTVRNRITLRRIPTPVQIHRPVAIPGEVMLPSETGFVPPAPPAKSCVTRSRLLGDTLARQNSLIEESSSQHGKLPGKDSMSADEACGKIMRKVADWNIPGNILYEAFHNSPPKATHSADPGKRKPVESLPDPLGQPSTEVSAGARGDSRSVIRSGHSPVLGGNVTTQDHGLGVGSVLQDPDPGLQLVNEVGPQLVRRSTRQRSNVVPFQAGQSGMEQQSVSKDTGQ